MDEKSIDLIIECNCFFALLLAISRRSSPPQFQEKHRLYLNFSENRHLILWLVRAPIFIRFTQFESGVSKANENLLSPNSNFISRQSRRRENDERLWFIYWGGGMMRDVRFTSNFLHQFKSILNWTSYWKYSYHSVAYDNTPYIYLPNTIVNFYFFNWENCVSSAIIVAAANATITAIDIADFFVCIEISATPVHIMLISLLFLWIFCSWKRTEAKNYMKFIFLLLVNVETLLGQEFLWNTFNWDNK